MRITGKVVLIWTILLGTSAGGAQPTATRVEEHIRRLEQEEVAALLQNDMAGVRRNWASDYVVNNPFNVVVDASKGPIQAGTLTYSSFVREVERVLVHGNTVIVMGRETVVPSGTSPDAGKTIHRRYTNVWMKRGGRWLLTARHANVVCEPEARPNSQ
jgi:ketosteroid isomerase-like protein